MWTVADRLMALVWQAERDATCGGCGQPRSESMAPENRNAYEVEAYTCHACVARELHLKEATSSGFESHGVYYVAVRSEVNGAD